ncbi:efflux RND transporter periplasmic adaptor subunit [soil metagenome]
MAITHKAITKKQGIAMALIVLAGLLGGGAVLLSERSEAGHAEGEAHTGEGKGAHGEEGHKDDHNEAGRKEEEHKEGEHKEAGKEGEHKDVGHQEAGHKEGEERRVALNPAQVAAAGITIEAAGPARLRSAASFQGEIRVDEDRTAHVVPRLAGVAEAVNASLGQSVKKGQVLAVIASTSLSEQRSELLTAQKRFELARATHEREKKLWQEKISAEQDYQQAQAALQEADIAVHNARQKLSAVGAAGVGSAGAGLNRFEVRAPFAGTIVEKHLSLGEAVKEDASIFTLSDLSSVWAEFAVAPKDLAAVRVGQKVVVSSTAFESRVEGRIAYVGALLGEQTRTARARVTLTNPQGAWRPGLFVTVAVQGDEQPVPVAVNADAVQTIDGETMLFVASPGGFVARPVKLGRSDGQKVELLAGLQAGESYAASKTFVLKSELGKASAEHGH